MWFTFDQLENWVSETNFFCDIFLFNHTSDTILGQFYVSCIMKFDFFVNQFFWFDGLMGFSVNLEFWEDLEVGCHLDWSKRVYWDFSVIVFSYKSYVTTSAPRKIYSSWF